MKKNIMTLVLICLGAITAFAQNNSGTKADNGGAPIQPESKRSVISELIDLKSPNWPGTNSAISAADVGEPDSFGGNVKFLGTAATGFVIVYHSCDPAVLQAELNYVLRPDDRCLAVPPGLPVTTHFNDIGRINLPKNAAANVIYTIQQNLMHFRVHNPNSNQVLSTVVLMPSLTIVSDALNDPTAINPNTGMPFNGSMTVVTSQKFMGKTYEAFAQETVNDRYTTSAVRGFARSFFADLGLPQNVINELYKKPMTIKLNLRVTANSFVTYGYFSYGVRFLGN